MQNFRAKPNTPDGRRRRAGPGRADDRLRHRAPGDGPGDEHPGAAEPVGRLRAAAAVGHQRLGRGLPPHPGLREPRGPLARHRRASRALCADAGYELRERLTIYPEYLADDDFLDPGVRRPGPGPGRRATVSRATSPRAAGRRWPHERHLLPHGDRDAHRRDAGAGRARPPGSTTPRSRRALEAGLLPVETAGADAPGDRLGGRSPPWRWSCSRRGVPGWRITRAPRRRPRRRARRPRAHRRRLPAHRPRRARGGDRARLAARDLHARLGGRRLPRRGPRRDRRRGGRPGCRRLEPAGGRRPARRHRPARAGRAHRAAARDRDRRCPRDARPAAVHRLARPDRRLRVPRGRATAGPPAATRTRRCRRGACRPSGTTTPGARAIPRRAWRGSIPTWPASSSARWRDTPPRVAEIERLFRARGPEVEAIAQGGRRAARAALRRHRHLRGQPQHQLHQPVLLPLRLLRLLARAQEPQPARRPVHPERPRGGRTAPSRPGSAGRPRSACRAASTPTSPATSTSRCSRASRSGCPRCTCTASRRSRSGRAPTPSGSACASSCARLRDAGPRHPAGHRRRDPRRPRARPPVPRQGAHRRMGRGDDHRPRARAALDHDDDDGPHRRAAAHGPTTSRCCARSSGAPAGFTEFVPLPVRPHGLADLPAGQGAARPDLGRGGPGARGRADRPRRPDRQHPGLVGEARAGRRRAPARRRLQRPRRHPDGREHLPRLRAPRTASWRPPRSSRPTIRGAGRTPARRNTVYDLAREHRLALPGGLLGGRPLALLEGVEHLLDLAELHPRCARWRHRAPARAGRSAASPRRRRSRCRRSPSSRSSTSREGTSSCGGDPPRGRRAGCRPSPGSRACWSR